MTGCLGFVKHAQVECSKQPCSVQEVVMNERGESAIRPFFIEDSILTWIHEDEKNNVNLP